VSLLLSLIGCWPGSPPPDVDGDGFAAAEDCDDLDPDRNPGAAEVCRNHQDDDCDGSASACPLQGSMSAADADLAIGGPYEDQWEQTIRWSGTMLAVAAPQANFQAGEVRLYDLAGEDPTEPTTTLFGAAGTNAGRRWVFTELGGAPEASLVINATGITGTDTEGYPGVDYFVDPEDLPGGRIALFSFPDRLVGGPEFRVAATAPFDDGVAFFSLMSGSRQAAGVWFWNVPAGEERVQDAADGWVPAQESDAPEEPLVAADVDGDGDDELLAALTYFYPGAVLVLDQPSGIQTIDDSTRRITGADSSQVLAVADLQGDGYVDVALIDDDGAFAVLWGPLPDAEVSASSADAVITSDNEGMTSAAVPLGSIIAADALTVDGVTWLAVGHPEQVLLFAGPDLEGHVHDPDAVAEMRSDEESFGASVALGDANTDGLVDVAVIAPEASGALPGAGVVYVFSSGSM
jgi:hypothetical protein